MQTVIFYHASNQLIGGTFRNDPVKMVELGAFLNEAYLASEIPGSSCVLTINSHDKNSHLEKFGILFMAIILAFS